jgi:hypothetical protein
MRRDRSRGLGDEADRRSGLRLAGGIEVMKSAGSGALLTSGCFRFGSDFEVFAGDRFDLVLCSELIGLSVPGPVFDEFELVGKRSILGVGL